jgi:hypothetical protein
MTNGQPPTWAVSVPSTAGVHTEPPSTTQWQNLTQDQVNALRSKLLESILQVVVQLVTGGLLPGSAGTQLTNWANNLPLIGPIVTALTGGNVDPGAGLAGLTSFFNFAPGTSNILSTLTSGAETLAQSAIDTLVGFLGGSGTGNSTSTLNSLLGKIPLIGNLVPALTGGNVPGSAGLAGLASFFNFGSGTTDITTLLSTLGTNFAQLVASFIPGATGGTQADYNTIVANILSILGNPAGLISGGFNPVAAGTNMLQNVLTPAGALSTFTQIPGHLFGNLSPGSPMGTNVLPDGGFDDPASLTGETLWSWDGACGYTKLGSAHTTVQSGVQRELIGMPVTTSPGQATNMSVYTRWTGLTAGSGNVVVLAANAYDVNDNLISDTANRVLNRIASPTLTSETFSGTDPSGTAYSVTTGVDSHQWVLLQGGYMAPTGTAYVRMSLEVEATATAGDVWFDDCKHMPQGLVDASLLGNIENIVPLLPTSVQGFSGIVNMVNTWQHMLDGLGSAFNPTGDVSGLQFSDLFSLAQTSTQNAITAAANSASNRLVLGNRTNKSAAQGANPTSQTSLTLGHFSSAGALTTTSLAAGNTMAQRVTVPEVATPGFLEFMLSGTSVTNIFANVYKIDPSANTKTALWNSANIASLVPSSTNHVRVLMAGFPQVNASDQLLLEIVNGGTNALTVVSKTTGAPNNTNEVIQNVGFSRATSAGGNSPTSLTSAQGSYSGTVPYAVIGIANVPADYHPPADQTFPSATTFTAPSWLRTGDAIDWIVLAGGGGGQGEQGYNQGRGGNAGSWAEATLICGTDFVAGTVFTVTPGGGGFGITGYFASGGNGGNSTVTWTDPLGTARSIVAVGGAGGGTVGNTNTATQYDGDPAGTVTFPTSGGLTYFGGAECSAGVNGNYPGGGGGGAVTFEPASGAGAAGEIWNVCRQVT